MLFPISTDRQTTSTPWITAILIGMNCIVFVHVTRQLLYAGPEFRDMLQAYMLNASAPKLVQFVTYQFLHADAFHLVGNMLFLYIFGRAVEDRLGKVAYLAFYLAAGVFAGVGHCLFEAAPVIGASGAIAGVSGAYLALFPESRVRFFYCFWFYCTGTFEVSSKLVIAFYFAMNLFSFVVSSGGAGVAYGAHLAGYIVGFVVGMLLLLVRLVPRSGFDMLAAVEQYRRRRAFVRSQREADEAIAASHKREFTPEEQISHKLRAQINDRFAAHDPAGAARIYRDLVRHDPKSVLSRQHQIDVANQLMAERKHDDAALAYQKFLDNNNPDPQRHEVQLILALLLARYLAREEADIARATALLDEAAKRAHGDQERQLIDQLRGELARRGSPKFS